MQIDFKEWKYCCVSDFCTSCKPKYFLSLYNSDRFSVESLSKYCCVSDRNLPCKPKYFKSLYFQLSIYQLSVPDCWRKSIFNMLAILSKGTSGCFYVVSGWLSALPLSAMAWAALNAMLKSIVEKQIKCLLRVIGGKFSGRGNLIVTRSIFLW